MVYLFGLLSALMFALGLVLQQRGALQTKAPEGDPHFLREIIRKPVWLAGCVLLFCGWLLQAAALDRGSLALVQSLQALSLVFALPLGARLTGQLVARRAVIGAGVTLLGIVLLLTLGRPRGGITHPAAAAWWISGFAIAALIAVLVLLGWQRRGSVPAALFGAAAGLAFAFQAGATKMLVIQYAHGFGTVFLNWPLYLFVAAEAGGFTLQQGALKTGALAPAAASLNATTLAASVILGVTVFQESLAHGQGQLPLALFGLALAIVGVVTLASPAPLPLGVIAG